MELSDWFKGFEKGISCLDPEQRASFFFGMREKLCEMWNAANLPETI